MNAADTTFDPLIFNPQATPEIPGKYDSELRRLLQDIASTVHQDLLAELENKLKERNAELLEDEDRGISTYITPHVLAFVMLAIAENCLGDDQIFNEDDNRLFFDLFADAAQRMRIPNTPDLPYLCLVASNGTPPA